MEILHKVLVIIQIQGLPLVQGLTKMLEDLVLSAIPDSVSNQKIMVTINIQIGGGYTFAVGVSKTGKIEQDTQN